MRPLPGSSIETKVSRCEPMTYSLQLDPVIRSVFMPKPPSVVVTVYAETSVGRARVLNEDSFVVANLSTAEKWTSEASADDSRHKVTSFDQGDQGCLLAVSDGIGGAPGGDVASRLAVNGVHDRFLELLASSAHAELAFLEKLRLAIELTNQDIHRKSKVRMDLARMGATFTAAALSGATAHIAQVGDSRAYLIRNETISQLTRDQSLVGALLEAGYITESQARRHPNRSLVLQALGTNTRVDVAMTQLQLRPADILILCSDGLSNKLQSDRILEAIKQAASLKDACGSLISLAKNNGERDDITILIAQITGRWSESEDAAPGARDAEVLLIPNTGHEIRRVTCVCEKGS
jgi:PPM family protein phosphatase